MATVFPIKAETP